ncbi:MAG: redoxin domain-containing protein [Planctomycetes bacterium]|nr:redoxin domain-containing protein [Planctomycetota bacterium]
MANEHLQPRSSPIAVGESAPDFTLTDQNKGEWSLAEHVKKGDVVLCFYPLAFTSVCSTEMRCVSDDFSKWSGKGSTVVGVSCDSFAANKAWAEKEGYKHTLLSDIHRSVCKAYGLYWPELNVANRGTVVIGKDASGKGKVKFVQARQPGNAMKWEDVLAMV